MTPGAGPSSLPSGLQWQIDLRDVDSEANHRASLSDYWLEDEDSSLMTFTQVSPGIYLSNIRAIISGDLDFRLKVHANDDHILEGTETVSIAVVVPEYNNYTTGEQTVNITEDYVDARSEKDETSTCPCKCTTCGDGVATDSEAATGDTHTYAAGGDVVVSTSGQGGAFPVIHVGLTLPDNKTVPTSISVYVQVVEPDLRSDGSNKGLGRKPVASNSAATQTFTLNVPAGSNPGDALSFAIQVDLSAQLQSWQRDQGANPAGSSGVTEQIVPIELLAYPDFPATNPDGSPLSTDDKFSGWVGRLNHAARDESASSIAPGLGKNVAYAGIDRLIRNQSIMVPDVPADGSSSQGNVKYETGSMLYRADGSTSWFAGNSVTPPDTQDVLSGDYLTDRFGNKKRFDTLGNMIERIDSSGNVTTYQYNTEGTLASVTDPFGQVTMYTYTSDTNGTYATIERSLSATATETKLLSWTTRTVTVDGQPVVQPIFRVQYDDPDGVGVGQESRQETFVYKEDGRLEQVEIGEVGGTPHVTYFAYNTSSTGDGRLSSITYADGSSLTLDLTREQNSLISATNPNTTNPLAFIRSIPEDASPLPNYAVTTYKASGASDPQRTIYQLDHRGRVLRQWDPVQVHALGLDVAGISWDSGEFAILEANVDLSFENSVAQAARDSLGRITGTDWGEVLATRTPDPDKIVSGGVLVSNGPQTRQETTYSYSNNNITSIQRPLQSAETMSWNDTFDVPVSYLGPANEKMYQTVDSASGLVTEQSWEGTGPAWQNPAMPQDVSGDGYISGIDSLIVTNYINTTGGGPVPAGSPSGNDYYDVNGDDFVTSIDVLLINNYINNPTPANLVVAESTILSKTQYTYSDGSDGLPKGLVTQQKTITERTSGDNIVNYVYYNTPTDQSRHGRLESITEAAGTSAEAVTTFDYDARGNLSLITDPAGRQTKRYYDNRDRLIAELSSDPDGIGPLLPNLVRYDYDVFGNVIATELISTKLEGTQLLTTAVATSSTYDIANRVTATYQQRSSVSWYLYLDGSGTLQRTTSQSTAVAGSLVTVAALTTLAEGNSAVPNLPGDNTTLQGLKTTYTYFASGSPNSVTVTEIDMAASTPSATERTRKTTLDQLNRVVASVTPDPGTGLTTTADDQRENGGFVTRTSYDNVGNVASVTNGLDQTTSFTYDALNRIIEVATPSATSGGSTINTQYSYSTTRYGWVVTETDPAGKTIQTQLDGLGRARTISGTAVSTKALRYWTDGTLKSTKDQRGNITDYDYDVLGRLSSITDPPPKSGVARSVTSYEYTVDSLLESVTDPLGRVTTFSYDEGGRRSRVTEPDPDGAGSATASYTDFTYDSLGNLLTQSDALGHTTSYTLDSSFQTLTSTDPNSATTTFTYDSFGQVASVVDPLSNSTLYTYNNVGQVVTEDKPVSGTSLKRTYTYDGLGNMRSLVDRNGRTTTSTDDDRTTEWSYDNRNRVTAETWKTGATVDRTFTYIYDTLDRTISLTDSDSLATDFEFAYDDRGQLQAERQVTGLVGTSVVLDREFDGDGNRTYLATNFGGTLSGTGVAGGIRDSVVNYYYDAMNRVWVVVQSTASQGSSSGVNTVAPKTALFQFNAASQVTDVRRYNATTNSSANLKVHSRYAYDGAGRLTSITHGKSEIASGESWDGTSTLPASLGSTNMLAGYFLSYDAANRVTSFASQRDAFQTTYSYDAMDQLTSATSAAISGMTPTFTLPGSETYNLDANGNRKSSGGASQSASQTQNHLQTDGTYNYAYDDEGNVTSRTEIATGEVTDYTWDHRNRLVSVIEKTSATGTVTKQTEFVYDAFDQRVAKRVDLDGNGSWDKYEAFVWADGHEVLRFVDSDGDGSQAFRVANRYLYSDAVDQLIADEQYTNNTGPEVGATSGSATAGNTLWALADHLGSVRDVVDNNGVVRQHVVFNSFGNRLLEVDYDTSGTQIANSNAAAIDELFGYTGRDWDSDVGLQYNRARWYDPSTGRWMSQDPIEFAAGDMNLYRYVSNHPAYATDSNGLEEIELDIITFIPREWVMVMPGVWLRGDNRKAGATPDGSYRIKTHLVLDTDKIGNAIKSAKRSIGESEIMFGCELPGVGGEFVSAEFTATGGMTGSETATGKNGIVEIEIDNKGHVPRRFIITAPAPYINYAFSGFAREEGTQIYVELKFRHDGFPAYELFANRQPVYCHDPEKEWQTPLSLFGKGEYTGVVWFVIDSNSGRIVRKGTGSRVDANATPDEKR